MEGAQRRVEQFYPRQPAAPAGAAAARLLATWGHSVQLLTKTVDPSRSLGESLPPSCRKLFDLLGATAAIDGAGFLASSGNTVWWGDETTRTACFADGATGLQVERHDLDALLLRLAAQAGAQVQANALVRGARLAPLDGRPGPAAATISYSTDDSSTHTIEAQFVLDCSGRAGVIARRGFRVHDVGRTTLALTAVWMRRDAWDLGDETHTLVETYSDGWAWSVPVTPSRRYVTVMVDPRVTDLDRGSAVTACYEAELAKTAALRRVLAQATRVTLDLSVSRNGVVLTISDNGKGFETQRRGANGKTADGIGLRNMHERLEFHNGELTVSSSGNGTTITARLPKHLLRKEFTSPCGRSLAAQRYAYCWRTIIPW